MRKVKVFQRFAVFVLTLLVLEASAQNDSAQFNDKKFTKLLAKVSEDSVKLARYKGMIAQFEKEKNDAANQAQQSADDNKRAADKLADNPQDKKLARRARSAARKAKSDSQKARVTASKLDDLNKDIRKLTTQLGKEQAKLDKYQPERAPAISAQ